VTCFCVLNRQAFSWCILSDLKVSTLGLYLKLGLYRMSVYSVFCLDRFYCTFKLRVLNIFSICWKIAWYLLKYNYLIEFFFALVPQAMCTRYKIMWYSLSVTCDRSMVFYGYSGFLHQWNWPHNITEILVKLALSTIKPNQPNVCFGLLEDCTALVFSLYRFIRCPQNLLWLEYSAFV